MVPATANKRPAQDATSVDEDSKLHDGDLLKGYSHLNQSLVAELQSKLAKKEWVDLTQVVTKWGRRYPFKRRQLENLCSKKGNHRFHFKIIQTETLTILKFKVVVNITATR